MLSRHNSSVGHGARKSTIKAKNTFLSQPPTHHLNLVSDQDRSPRQRLLSPPGPRYSSPSPPRDFRDLRSPPRDFRETRSPPRHQYHPLTQQRSPEAYLARSSSPLPIIIPPPPRTNTVKVKNPGQKMMSLLQQVCILFK